MIHKLKIDKNYADDIRKGLKTFEVRFNDRDYKVGDTLAFDKRLPYYKVTYIHSGLGLKDGYVILGLEEII